jgi:hypothetical protein
VAKRRRGTKSSDLLVLLWIAALAYLGYPPREHGVAWIVVVPAVALFWIAFLMPTKCDYLTQRNKPCDRGVRGKLRGCRDHARWKRDAMFAAFGTSNPGRHLRVMWHAPGAATRPARISRHRAPASQPDPNAQSGVHNLIILTCTVVSTVAGVITLLIA